MEDSYLQLLIALLSGGVIQYIAQYFIAKKKHDQSEMEMIIRTWSQDNERLREIEKQNRQRIDSLENEITLLRAQIVALESAQLNLPIPMWLKDLKGTMLTINKAYEKSFLEPRGYEAKDYIGSKDTSIWTDKLASIFSYSDDMIRRGKDVYYSIVDVPYNDKYTDKWIVVKYPRLVNNDIIGIGGLAIPYNAVIKYAPK